MKKLIFILLSFIIGCAANPPTTNQISKEVYCAAEFRSYKDWAIRVQTKKIQFPEDLLESFTQKQYESYCNNFLWSMVDHQDEQRSIQIGKATVTRMPK